MDPTVAGLAGVLIGAGVVLAAQLTRRTAAPSPVVPSDPPVGRPSSRRSARARFSPVGLSDVELAELEQDSGVPDDIDQPAEPRPYDEDDADDEEPGR